MPNAATASNGSTAPGPPPIFDDGGYAAALRAGQAKAAVQGAQVKQAAQKTLGKIESLEAERESLRPPPQPEMPKFEPPPSQNPWGEVFGQLALPLAIFGSALTKQPLLNGLNAAAAVNNAYNQGDVQRFNFALQQWQAQTDYALKLHQYQMDFYKDALDRVKEGKADAMAELEVQLRAMKDESALQAYYTGGPDAVLRMMQWRQMQWARAPEIQQKAQAASDKFQETESLKQIFAQQVGHPWPPQTPEDQAIWGRLQATAQGKIAGTEVGKLETYQVKTPDGKTTTVELEQGKRPGEWYTADGKPYDPQGAELNKLPPGQGRQQATQLTAIRGAGNEAVASLKNLVELPVTATSGTLMGVQFRTPEEMGEAIKRSLAREFTPEEVKDLYISFAGVGRSLATLEAQGRAQGLVGLAEQMDRLIPQSGDKPITIMRRYAEIRQIIDRAMENAIASGVPTTEAQSLFENIAKEAREAVPFTVHDVNVLEYGGREGLKDFAEKMFSARGLKTQAMPSWATGSATGPNKEKIYTDGTRWFHADHTPVK